MGRAGLPVANAFQHPLRVPWFLRGLQCLPVALMGALMLCSGMRHAPSRARR